MQSYVWTALPGTRIGKILCPVLVLFLQGCGYLLPANNQTIDPASLPAGQFELDPVHSSVIWKVSHLGFSRYVGRFNTLSGRLDFDPDQPVNSKLEVEIDTASIATPDPEFDKTLRGSTWLDTANHPTATFVGSAIKITGETTGTVDGLLELKGQTQPVTLSVTFNGGAPNLLTLRYTLGFRAQTTISRSAFSIDSLVPAIGDNVELEIEAEFLRVD